MNESFIKSFFQTAINCELNVYSDDFCCKILSWVYVFGGGREETVVDPFFREAILYAQKRLNIAGGEIPNIDLLPLLQQYVKEAESYRKQEIDKPFWITEIEDKYKIKTL
jgi:hypothetical protein